MKEQISNAVEFLKVNVHGCITGSCLLGYFEGQDVDVFLYMRELLISSFYCYITTYVPDYRAIRAMEKIRTITTKAVYNRQIWVNIH
jgi:hypothetical protein